MSQLLVPDMLSFDTDTGHRRRCGMVGKHRDTEDKVRAPAAIENMRASLNTHLARNNTNLCVSARAPVAGKHRT